MQQPRHICFAPNVGDILDVPGGCFAERLGRFIDVSAAERTALARMEERVRPLRRGGVLLRANDRANELFLLRRGVMMSYTLLDDGSRQILSFHYPGDLLGWSALAYRKSPETLAALTEAEVCPFDRSVLWTLAVEYPRLSTAITALHQIERLALTDRLAGLGRTPARARVAALLIEIHGRTRVDKAAGSSFALGMTQEEMGDATGLTAVHVNRMLRQLEEERLIAREGGRVTLLDEAALAHAANYVDRFKDVDLGWLPPAG